MSMGKGPQGFRKDEISTDLFEGVVFLIFLLSSIFADTESFSFVTASLFNFFDSTSTDLVNLSTFFMSTWKQRQHIYSISNEEETEREGLGDTSP